MHTVTVMGVTVTVMGVTVTVMGVTGSSPLPWGSRERRERGGMCIMGYELK